MPIKIILEKISFPELQKVAEQNYGNMVKGVVDLKRRIIALGGELHADAEAVLLEDGSKQEDLWGFNIYTDKSNEERLEYTSFINIRPRQGNRAIEIQDSKLKDQVREVVDSLVEKND